MLAEDAPDVLLARAIGESRDESRELRPLASPIEDAHGVGDDLLDDALADPRLGCGLGTGGARRRRVLASASGGRATRGRRTLAAPALRTPARPRTQASRARVPGAGRRARAGGLRASATARGRDHTRR